MRFNARRASIALFAAFIALPSAARADSITMRMLGLKELPVPITEEWKRGIEPPAAPAVNHPAPRKPFAGTKAGVFLEFPALLTSRRTLPIYAFQTDPFVKPSTSFPANTSDDSDGRRARRNTSGGSGGFGGASVGGYSGVPTRTASGRRVATNGGDLIDRGAATITDNPTSGVSDFTSDADAFNTASNDRRPGSRVEVPLGGGTGNELLDDGIEISLQADSAGQSFLAVSEGQNAVGGQGSDSSDKAPAVEGALIDDVLSIPPSSALTDVKPWVSGFTPDAVKDDGQFVVYDFVTGDPVWTTDTLEEMLEEGSLTALVPNFDGSIGEGAMIPNPEPASLVLFASGLIGAGMRWRSKRRHRGAKS